MSRDDFELQCSASHCSGFSCCKARAPGAQGSVTAVSGLESTGLVVEVHGLSCSEACGTFLDQGSSLSFLHWWVDSLPLSHQGNPKMRDSKSLILKPFIRALVLSVVLTEALAMMRQSEKGPI